MTRNSPTKEEDSFAACASLAEVTMLRRRLLLQIEVPPAVRAASTADAVKIHLESPRIHGHSYRRVGRKSGPCSGSTSHKPQTHAAVVTQTAAVIKADQDELVSRTIANRKMIRNAMKAGVTLSDSTLNSRQEVRKGIRKAMNFLRDYATSLRRKMEECVTAPSSPSMSPPPPPPAALQMPTASILRLPPTHGGAAQKIKNMTRRLSANCGLQAKKLVLRVQPCCGTWSGDGQEEKKPRDHCLPASEDSAAFELSMEMLSFSKPFLK